MMKRFHRLLGRGAHGRQQAAAHAQQNREDQGSDRDEQVGPEDLDRVSRQHRHQGIDR